MKIPTLDEIRAHWSVRVIDGENYVSVGRGFVNHDHPRNLQILLGLNPEDLYIIDSSGKAYNEMYCGNLDYTTYYLKQSKWNEIFGEKFMTLDEQYAAALE